MVINVNLNTNLVMGRVQRVTSTVMDTVRMKGIGNFVMGNVCANGSLVVEIVLRVL